MYCYTLILGVQHVPDYPDVLVLYAHKTCHSERRCVDPLVVALEGQLKARGISIVKERFAVQKAKLFGVIDTDYQVTEEGGAAIGIRTANDKSLALPLAIGYRNLYATTWPSTAI
jgi:hypothetical protein